MADSKSKRTVNPETMQNDVRSWIDRHADSQLKFIKKNDNKFLFSLGKFNLSIVNRGDNIITEIVDTEEIPIWIPSLNEYSVENKPNIKRILTRIVKLYTKVNLSSGNNILHSKDIITNDVVSSFNIEEARYRKLIEDNIPNSVSSLNTNEANVHKLFNQTQIGQILINELFNLRDRYKDDGKIIVTVDNLNIYQWNIKINRFSNDDLNKSLEILKDKYGYNYVEFEISFHSTLYPNYPPFVKILRPRLQHNLMVRITNTRYTQLNYWSSCRSVGFIIDKIYAILNKNAEIDIENHMNNIDTFKNGAYHELESIIVKLASLTDTSDYVFIDDKEKELVRNDKTVSTVKNPKENKGQSLTAGVGYSEHGSSTWDIDEYIKLQKEKDRKIVNILSLVQESILLTPEDKMSDLYKIIDSSYLIPFFKSYLKGSTLIEMSKHADIYKSIFSILQLISKEETIYLYDDTTTMNLFKILTQIKKEIDTIKKIDNSETTDEDKADGDIIEMVLSVYNMIETPFKKYLEEKQLIKQNEIDAWDKKVDDAKNSTDKTHRDYIEVMDGLKFGTVEGIKNFYKFGQNDKNIDGTVTAIMPNANKKRISKEYGTLCTSLATYYESSIFVRADENNIKCMRVMITGPDDTPYDCGVFMFDVYLPSEYPYKHPYMRFLNHGGKRFNPNLYNDGKVCLSLLGTWRGNSKSEEWNPDTSSLQQLFTSVQSLILISKPYFNEPGFERDYNTEKGKQSDRDYNENIRLYTMTSTMADLIENPALYPEFEDTIKAHFKLTKDRILKVAEKWTEESYVQNKVQYEKQFNRIKEGLEKY